MNINPCEFRIITNGILLKKDISNALIDLNVDIISVSIDATTPEIFKITRGKAHRFEDVVKNTINFSKIKKRQGCKMAITSSFFCRTKRK